MSEIKTVLNFFDKNNGLKAVLKDLKAIKKLQSEINKQKGGVSSDNLKERTAALKEITRLQKQLDKERKKAINTGKQAVGIEKELVKVQEQDRKVKKQLKVARTEKFRQLQETNLALRNQKKLVKADIIENSKLSSVYERQSAKLNRLRKELKNLILTEGEGSAKTKKLALEVSKLDKRLKGADAAAGQFQRNVGNYPSALKRATGALRNFAGALGITAGITGLVRVVGDTINVFKEFESSLSSLSSITGATGEDLKFYEEQAARIGETTTLSASQAVEAFKLIGSAKPELLANKEALVGVTEQAILLAEAAGLELPEAASSLANALNQFNLPAEESGRVINALAAGSKFGAAAIPELSEAITKFGVAAASSNISIEESIGAVELLAEKGIAGAEAGTKLRNVFSKLDIAKSLPPKAADQLAKFGVNTDIVSDSTLTLKERLTELSKIQDDATALTFVFGEQNKVAGQAILQNVERVDELTQAVTGTSTAIEQAGINVDNFEGDMKSLSSVVESVQIAIGKKLKSSLRGFIQGLIRAIRFVKENTQLISKWVKVIGTLVAGVTAYKVAQALANKESKISLFLTKADATAKKVLSVVQGVLTGKTNLATKATKLFNLAVKSNPIGLFIGLLTAAVAAFFAFRDGANEAAESQRQLNEAQQEGVDLKLRAKTIEDRFKTINKLNKVQLQNLLSDIESELSANEEKEAKLIALKENNQSKFEAAEKQNKETLIKLRQELADETDNLEKIQIQNRIDNLEAFARNVEREVEGTTLVETTERKKRLESFTADVAERIALLKKLDNEKLKSTGVGKEKERLSEIDNQRKRLKILDDIEIRAIEDATEKKKALRSQAFEEKIDQLERSGLLTAEIEKKLTQELQDDLTQIELDAELERQATLKSENDKLMAELEKQAAEEIALAKKTKEEEAKIAEEALALRKEQQQEAIDLSKELVDTTIENLTMESEAKIEALDRQLSAEQDFLSQNENLSAREIEFRRKKAAELELQRIEEQKRLEKLAKVQAFFDLVAAFASSGDGQGAVGKAATTMAAAEVISEGFHDGGYTGDGNEYKEAGVVHKGEFVNTKAQTTEYGMKGWKAKDFDKAVSDGYFNQFADSNIFADQNAKFLSVQNNEVGYDFKNLENKLDSVINAVNNSPTTDFEINGEYFIKRTHRKGSTTTKKRKLG